MAEIDDIEVIIPITVDTSLANKSMAELKNEVRDAKKALDQTTIGTDDYNKAVTRLSNAQSTLTKAEQLYKEQLAEVAKNTTTVSTATDIAGKSLAQMRLQLSSMLKEVAKLTPGTQGFVDMSAKVGILNQQIKDAEKTYGSFVRNVGNYGQQVIDTTTGALGGIQAQAQYLITELPNLAQSPLIFIRAIGNNLAGIGMQMQQTGATIGSVFKAIVSGFSGPLGIIALFTTLVTVITANWDAIKNFTASIFNFERSLSKSEETIRSAGNTLSILTNNLNAATKSTKELSAATIFQAQTAVKELGIAQRVVIAQLAEEEAAYKRLSELQVSGQAEIMFRNVQIQNSANSIEALKNTIKAYSDAIGSADAQLRIMQIDLEEQSKIQAKIASGSGSKIPSIEDLVGTGEDIARKQSEDYWKSLPKYLREMGRTIKTDSPLSLLDMFDINSEEFTISNDRLNEIVSDLESRILAAVDNRETAGGLFNRVLFGGDVDAFGDEVAKGLGFATQGFNALQQLSNTAYQNRLDEAQLDGKITAEEKKQLEKAWKQKQAYDIAAATSSGLLSIANAAATVPFLPMGLINAGVAATMMAANIAQIKSVKMPGVNVGSSGGGSSSTTGNAIPQPMAVLTSPIIETNTRLNSADIDRINITSRVYVVESDITNAQNRVKVVENETSF